MRSDFEERRQNRIDRYRAKATGAAQESTKQFQRSHDEVKHIPIGQPILVGHHSEKAHRATLARSHNAMRKSAEANSKAEYYREKAAAAENNRAIFSDDPDAVVKLQAKIAAATDRQNRMKLANALIRKKPKNERTDDKVEELKKLFPTLNEGLLHKLFQPDFCGRYGFPDYEIKNNNANIRRMKKRLESLKTEEAAETKTQHFEGFYVVENAEENRIQLIFRTKQDYFDLCKNKGINMKYHGFRFSRQTGGWQRHLNNAGRAAVKQVIGLMEHYNNHS